jgi:hypothetical protein
MRKENKRSKEKEGKEREVGRGVIRAEEETDEESC